MEDEDEVFFCIPKICVRNSPTTYTENPIIAHIVVIRYQKCLYIIDYDIVIRNVSVCPFVATIMFRIMSEIENDFKF